MEGPGKFSLVTNQYWGGIASFPQKEIKTCSISYSWTACRIINFSYRKADFNSMPAINNSNLTESITTSLNQLLREVVYWFLLDVFKQSGGGTSIYQGCFHLGSCTEEKIKWSLPTFHHETATVASNKRLEWIWKTMWWWIITRLCKVSLILLKVWKWCCSFCRSTLGSTSNSVCQVLLC